MLHACVDLSKKFRGMRGCPFPKSGMPQASTKAYIDLCIVFIFFSYRGGVDSEGRPVMVVVGAHFLLRCLDLEQFVLYVVKVIWLYPSA